MRVTVRTQGAFDELIMEQSDRKLVVHVDATEPIDVYYHGDTWDISVSGDHKVKVNCTQPVQLRGPVAVELEGDTHAYGGCDHLTLNEASTARVSYVKRIEAWGDSKVWCEHADLAIAFENSTIMATGDSTVICHGTTRVHASSTTRVTAYDKAQVYCTDRTIAYIHDEVQARAALTAVIHKHGGEVVAQGVHCHVIDHSQINLDGIADSKEWCSIYGMPEQDTPMFLYDGEAYPCGAEQAAHIFPIEATGSQVEGPGYMLHPHGVSATHPPVPSDLTKVSPLSHWLS